MIRRFLKADRGSATIEFVLWVPLFGFLLMVTSDASVMYLTETRMENASRDAARRVSTGEFTPAAISDYVLSQLDDGPYSVSTTCSTSDYACVNITRTVDSVVTFGVFSSLVGQSLSAETKMRLEPGVKFEEQPA